MSGQDILHNSAAQESISQRKHVTEQSKSPESYQNVEVPYVKPCIKK